MIDNSNSNKPVEVKDCPAALKRQNTGNYMCHTGAEGTELNISTTMEDIKVCIPGAEGTELLFPTTPPTTYIPSNATDQSLL